MEDRKAIDEQTEFRKLNTIYFFQNQIIRERRNSERKSIYYTNCFNNAFNSILNNDYIEARKSCMALKKPCLRWLLYLELKYYYSVFNKRFPTREDISYVFKVSIKRLDKYFERVLKKLPLNKFVARTYNEFIDFRNQEEKYKSLPIKNIAVCATMSAGKSTFVNALLGRDILPARNEATTAKITSVYDKDTAKSLFGFVQQNNTIEHRCLETNLSTINNWNDSDDVNRIFLQGNLDGIGNNNIIAAVHDTPGTNNSNTESHHDITFNFLFSQKLDAVIYVANATQLCTIDENKMIKEINKEIISKSKIPVIFILNKVDCLDSDKEDVSEIMKMYKTYLEEIGFENPKIFPLASKAARILKMVKNNMTENLTGKERKELKFIQTEFPDLISTGLPQVEEYIEQIIGGHND